jgi:hypothetical protein
VYGVALVHALLEALHGNSKHSTYEALRQVPKKCRFPKTILRSLHRAAGCQMKYRVTQQLLELQSRIQPIPFQSVSFLKLNLFTA